MKKAIFTAFIFGTVLLSGCSFERNDSNEKRPIVYNEENEKNKELNEKISQLEQYNNSLLQENKNLKERISDYQESEMESKNDSNNQISNSASTGNNEIIFDGCGKINNYQKKTWFSNFISALDSNNIVISDISEICLSLNDNNDNMLIAITKGGYCESGMIFQYNIPKNIITKATLNNHERGCVGWPSAFGKRNGNIIPLQGFVGDAGCSSTMYYDYDYIDNTIELKKECSRCQQEQETCRNY